MNIKYYPKPVVAVLHLILFLGVFLLFFARKYEWLRFDLLNGFLPEFHLYISNFSIAFLLLSGIGYLWLLMGLSMRYVLLLGLVILFLNFAFELWIPILNTPDMTDAYYGLVGVCLALIELHLIKRWGLRVI